MEMATSLTSSHHPRAGQHEERKTNLKHALFFLAVASLLILADWLGRSGETPNSFWAHGQSNTQRGGQFAPLLSLEEWKTLFRQLDDGFYELEERIRLRAYQLYELRRKQDGHALDDWLQAEAEVTERKSLSVAA